MTVFHTNMYICLSSVGTNVQNSTYPGPRVSLVVPDMSKSKYEFHVAVMFYILFKKKPQKESCILKIYHHTNLQLTDVLLTT